MRLVGLLLFLGAAMHGVPPAAQPWAFEPVDGLPHNTVSALLQDQRGFLWIGTADGLARYDGRQFRVFHREGGARSLASNTIQALAETASGALWVGTSAGACRLADEAVGAFACPAPSFDVLDVLVAGDAVWAITIDGAWRLNAVGTRFEQVRARERRGQSGGPLMMRFVSTGDHVVAAEGLGGGASVRRHRAQGARGPFIDETIHTLPPDRVAILAQTGRIRTFPTAWFDAGARPLRSGWDTLGRVAFVASASGEWLGAEAGLFHLSGQTAERVSVGEASPLGRAVLAVTVDRTGAVWVGTRSGLYVHDPARARFEHLDPSVAGAAAPVMAIATDSSGVRWIGTLGGGLLRQRPGGDLEPVGHPATGLWALHATADALWVGADGSLCRRTAARTTCLRAELARHDGAVYVYDLEPEGADGLWVGGSTLALVDAGTGTIRRQVSLDDVGTLTVLHRDRQGRLWVGIEKRGLWRLDAPDGDLRRVRVAGLDAASVWSIEPGPDTVWLGTSEGLFALDLDTQRAEPHALRLPGSTVYGVLADGAALWLTTGQGLARYRPADGALRLFGTDHGVQNVEFNRRAVHRAPDGRVALGGLRGVTSFDPAAFTGDPSPPATVVTRLRIEGAEGGALLAGSAVQLGPSVRTVAFDVAAPVPSGASSVRFAYRLAPLDSTWVEVDSDGIRFAGLSPGRYTFQARASHGDGVWGPPATVALTLAPPWYRTLWFRSLVVLALVGVGWGAVDARIRSVRREERMRWRIASDLHDDIGSGLSSVALLAEHVRDRGTLATTDARQLTSVARSARSMVESLREIVWFVDPAHDRPGAFEARVREAAATIVGPRATVEAPARSRLDAAPLAFRRDVYLVLKESLHNAARHAPGAAVSVRLEEVGGTAVLSVRDEGPGFDPDTVRPGTGLRSLRRRAESLGGSLTVESTPGRGTTITLQTTVP